MMHVRTVRVRAIALNTVVVNVTAAKAVWDILRLSQLQPENTGCPTIEYSLCFCYFAGFNSS